MGLLRLSDSGGGHAKLRQITAGSVLPRLIPTDLNLPDLNLPDLVATQAARSRRTIADPSWWAQGLLVAAIAWGAFAFGAVYPWAYWSLAGAVGAGSLLSLRCASSQPSLHLGPLIFVLMLFGLAVALQLVPVPFDWLRILSPRTLDVLRTYDLALGSQPDRHPLSLAPQLTAQGLTLFVSFALLVAGSARLATLRGPRGLGHAIVIIGVLLAMTAIIQKPLSTEKIYGLWMPQVGRNPFGPFVNRNHFAGWMMMALPIALGLLCGGVARGMRHVKPTFKERLLWLSSEDASQLLLLAAAAAVMALSLVLTMSRSGMAATLFALALTGVVALRRQRNSTRRMIVASYLVLLAVAVTAWVGVDTIVSRFAASGWNEFNNRRGAWADAVSIASIFPVTGTGLNTYAVATLFYQKHDLAFHYREAHNDYLQLAAEGGWLLAVPAVLCIATFGTMVWKRFNAETSSSGYWLRVGAVTGLAAIALQEMVDFSLQMPGNAALFAVLCGIALHRSPERLSR
jgi:putative inorganic carbon (HCO3(-)) transporter